MSFLAILLIAIGLALDAFAVSVAAGCATRRAPIRNAVRLSASFGIFQAAMPVIGWWAGMRLRTLIAGVDHWIAFGILTFIGVKMIVESRKLQPAEQKPEIMGWKILLLLSVATSVDALAVGLSLSFLNVAILAPALVIGGVTFVLCLAGFVIGSRFGHFFESRIEIIGGLMLIAIGIKIVIDHL